MSIQDLLEEGDTGEALLPAKVSDKGVHADRDGSEAPFDHCGRGICAANEGHTGTCDEASGWADYSEEASRGDNPSTGMPTARDAETSVTEEPVWGDVRHHRERIDQLNSWVRYWSARALMAERELRECQS